MGSGEWGVGSLFGFAAISYAVTCQMAAVNPEREANVAASQAKRIAALSVIGPKDR